jgi:hypothetical protein
MRARRGTPRSPRRRVTRARSRRRTPPAKDGELEPPGTNAPKTGLSRHRPCVGTDRAAGDDAVRVACDGTVAHRRRLMTGPYGTGRCRTGSSVTSSFRAIRTTPSPRSSSTSRVRKPPTACGSPWSLPTTRRCHCASDSVTSRSCGRAMPPSGSSGSRTAAGSWRPRVLRALRCSCRVSSPRWRPRPAGSPTRCDPTSSTHWWLPSGLAALRPLRPS